MGQYDQTGQVNQRKRLRIEGKGDNPLKIIYYHNVTYQVWCVPSAPVIRPSSLTTPKPYS